MSNPSPHAPFYATLAAICYLVTVAAVLAAYGKYSEAIGVGAAVTGLLAIARTPPAPSNPVATTQSGDVKVNPEPLP